MKCEQVILIILLVVTATVLILSSLDSMLLRSVEFSNMDYTASNQDQPATHPSSILRSYELNTFEHFCLIWNKLQKEVPANISFPTVDITEQVTQLCLSRGNISNHYHSDITMSGSEEIKHAVIKLLMRDYSAHHASWQKAQMGCIATNIKTEFDRYACYKVHLQSLHPFRYNVTVLTTCRSIQILVAETQLDHLSHGGSSFKAVLQSINSGFLVMCSSLDHFNGTYTIECPRIREWYEIIITRVYHDYIAFASDERINYAENVISGNVTVWDEVICDTLAPITWNELPGWREKNGRWW